jgi:hypothetical protein
MILPNEKTWNKFYKQIEIWKWYCRSYTKGWDALNNYQQEWNK